MAEETKKSDLCQIECVFNGKKDLSHQLLHIPRASHASVCRECGELPDKARNIVFDGFDIPDPQKDYSIEKAKEMLGNARKFNFGPYESDVPFFEKYGLLKK